MRAGDPPGPVYLVGAGPGPADLLTLRAAELLARADIVLHDALVRPEVLAIAARARLIPVGKRAGRPSTDQRFICRLMARLARRGGLLVRLKGGDPLLFGRATEEIAALRAAGLEVVCVPGVSAGFAAAAALSTSLTQRGFARSVAFLTPAVGRGETADGAWLKAALAADTAVLYMAAGAAQAIAEALIAAGLPPARPAAIVENAACADELVLRGRLCDLARLAGALTGGPAVVLIGEALAETDLSALSRLAAAA